MIPKLYDEDYLSVSSLTYGNTSTNGYGFLNTCQKCVVNEKTSGVFSLDMEILSSDKYARFVLPNTIIKITPNKFQPPQLFQVFKVVENKDKLRVSANHIKFLALNNIISRYNLYKDLLTDASLIVPRTLQGTAQEIFQLLKEDRLLLFEEYSDSTVPAENQKKFQFISDIDDVTRTVHLRDFANKKLGEFLYDSEYGMGLFNGEWLYDNFTISLLKKRGKSNAAKLRYGHDYKDLTIEYSSDNNYNVVVPYAKVINTTPGAGEENEFYLAWKPYFLETEEVNKYPRLHLVDISEHTPELEANTINGTGMTTAFNSIGVTFSGPYYRGKYRARGYEIAVNAELNYNSQTVQNLGLYDPVLFTTQSGKEISSSISGISFDALNERIINIELGNKPLMLQDVVEKRRR
jgi:phage-related protein